MNPLGYLQTMKREWTPDRYMQGKFTNEDETKFCAYGKIKQLCRDVQAKFIYYPQKLERIPLTNEALQALNMVSQKLMDMYPEEAEAALDFDPDQDFIVYTNDGPEGYEKIMRAIDAILLENSAEAIGTKVDNRELVPA